MLKLLAHGTRRNRRKLEHDAVPVSTAENRCAKDVAGRVPDQAQRICSVAAGEVVKHREPPAPVWVRGRLEKGAVPIGSDEVSGAIKTARGIADHLRNWIAPVSGTVEIM